jgi:hypothetical protein
MFYSQLFWCSLNSQIIFGTSFPHSHAHKLLDSKYINLIHKVVNINVNIQFRIESYRMLQLHVDRLSSVVEHLTCVVQILFSALLSYPGFSQVLFSGANTFSRKCHNQLPFSEQVGTVVTSRFGFRLYTVRILF